MDRTKAFGSSSYLEAAHRDGVPPSVKSRIGGVQVPGGGPNYRAGTPSRRSASSCVHRDSSVRYKASDLIALSYHGTYGLDVRVTRCSNNYGPNQHPEKLIPLFVTTLLDGGQVPLYGDGLNVRDWLHVDDHCAGITAVLENGRAGEIYNIGGGTELSNAELTQRLLDACGGTWEKNVRYVEDRKGHGRRYSLNWSKIRTELGYAPRHDFDEGLAETIAWYRAHRSWWSR